MWYPYNISITISPGKWDSDMALEKSASVDYLKCLIIGGR